MQKYLISAEVCWPVTPTCHLFFLLLSYIYKKSDGCDGYMRMYAHTRTRAHAHVQKITARPVTAVTMPSLIFKTTALHGDTPLSLPVTPVTGAQP